MKRLITIALFVVAALAANAVLNTPRAANINACPDGRCIGPNHHDPDATAGSVQGY